MRLSAGCTFEQQMTLCVSSVSILNVMVWPTCSVIPTKRPRLNSLIGLCTVVLSELDEDVPVTDDVIDGFVAGLKYSAGL